MTRLKRYEIHCLQVQGGQLMFLQVDCPVIVDMVRAMESMKEKLPDFGIKASSLASSDARERTY